MPAWRRRGGLQTTKEVKRNQTNALSPHSLSLRIEGMDCADCALKLEKGVSHLDGVAQCNVSFATAKMTLVYEPSVLDPDQIERRVRTLGYGVVMPGGLPAKTRATGAGRAGISSAPPPARRSRSSQAC